jgi:hypothetical protein
MEEVNREAARREVELVVLRTSQALMCSTRTPKPPMRSST